ncbi:hypothetical protein EV356DRAFT_533607 [Viridothelium virens]|uniref:Uncharacterized protein n=1 Tax=Viridothelium virens TaxID=1048519 RepID=A0A6A6H6A4_VIRVR|nr:hypothetical protein EV356DRAFT_533607 [Viridothelium virens]
MADFDDSDWSDDVSESDAQRSNYPFPLDRFTLNIRGPQLSLEEFKAELHRITRNSTEDELCEIHGKLEKPGTRFLHLGARNGVDYGMMNGLDGRFIMTGEHHKGELNFDVHSSATLAAFFIDELKTQEILMRPVGEDEPYAKPDLGPSLEIGTLITYSDKEGWNDTRFSVFKCLVDDSLWIVAQPRFFGYHVDSNNYALWERAEPRRRTYTLEGFDTPISCAQLTLDENDFGYDAGMQSFKHPKRTTARKLFDFTRAHSGGFVLEFAERFD